jgi:glycosyltransferase involved in cell wall biosynthesis
VDDGSTDGSRNAVEKWCLSNPDMAVRVIPGPCTGIPSAVNAGIAALSAPIVVRLDGHCRPARDYVELSVLALDREGVGVVGGVWEVSEGAETPVAWAIARAVSHPLGTGGVRYRNPAAGKPVTVDTVPFGCFRKALWNDIGRLDESLRSNEDYEFNARVRRRGLRVVLDPKIRCTYYARPTLRHLFHQYWRYGWWKARMLTRSPETIRLRQLVASLLVPLAVWVMAAGLVGDRRWLTLLVLYPLVLTLGSIDVALRHKRPTAALRLGIAFAVLQTAWSLGFWSALLGGVSERLVSLQRDGSTRA